MGKKDFTYEDLCNDYLSTLYDSISQIQDINLKCLRISIQMLDLYDLIYRIGDNYDFKEAVFNDIIEYYYNALFEVNMSRGEIEEPIVDCMDTAFGLYHHIQDSLHNEEE